MKTAAGALYALPVMVELDDAFALRDRRFRVDEYCRAAEGRVRHDVPRTPRRAGGSLALNLHPWLMGQAFRVEFLDEALAPHDAPRRGVGGDGRGDRGLVQPQRGGWKLNRRVQPRDCFRRCSQSCGNSMRRLVGGPCTWLLM